MYGWYFYNCSASNLWTSDVETVLYFVCFLELFNVKNIEIYIVVLYLGPFTDIKIESPSSSLPSVLLTRFCGAIPSGTGAGKKGGFYLCLINYR